MLLDIGNMAAGDSVKLNEPYSLGRDRADFIGRTTEAFAEKQALIATRLRLIQISVPLASMPDVSNVNCLRPIRDLVDYSIIPLFESGTGHPHLQFS